MSYPFVLSQKSISQQRDLFLFEFEYVKNDPENPGATMCGGWNLARHDVTIKTLYRWLNIVNDHEQDRNLHFQLRKIRLSRIAVLCYGLDGADGPPLSRDSTELMRPGVYGPFLNGEPYTGKVGDIFDRPSFRERERNYLVDYPGEQTNVPQVIVDAATQRDQGVCSVTGRTDLPTSIVWVYPPFLADEWITWDERSLKEDHKTVENAITLCTALIDPFTENMFSVDVEDNNRIVTFQNLPVQSYAPPLLSNLPSKQDQPASHKFWHMNLKWTLNVHFLGGDAEHEPHPDPTDLMEELAEDLADPTDPKWHSGIGAEVWEEFLEQKMQVAQAMLGPDDDEV